MPDSKLDTLTQRLDRLERESRWLKIGAAATASAIGVVLLAGAANPPTDLVAKSLRIVDDKGMPAISLVASGNGTFLGLQHDGKLRSAISAGEIVSFELYAKSGEKSRVELRVDESDTPVLLMVDDRNVIRTQLAIGKD